MSKAINRPRQNRVTPFGEFISHPSKGLFMGNRGDLHASDGSLGPESWRQKAWITCTLEGDGWNVTFDKPGHYYPLFFYDEAVALAAGHRPCGHCRPEALKQFKDAWRQANGLNPSQRLSARDIDKELHLQRTAIAQMSSPDLSEIPDGTFVELQAAPGSASLLWKGTFYTWTPTGYFPNSGISDAIVRVLTPNGIMKTLSAGYYPTIAPF